MVNPSREEGFTKIPNEILDVLSFMKLTAYEYRVLLFIIRKTYGWNKETDWISLSQFSEGTGILKQNISRTLKKLERRFIIIRTSNRHVGLQKNYYKWRKELQRSHNSYATTATINLIR